MDSGITALPLTDFLADPRSGRAVVDKLYGLLGKNHRILVWGPRVGAIELAEDLLMLWPSEGEVVAVNAVALCTRTRQDGQDSEWVQWVDTTPQKLLSEVMERNPRGIVVLFASAIIASQLPALLGGPWGLVTAIDATTADEARARFSALAGPAAKDLDVLVGLGEAGTSTFIREVVELDEAGATTPIATLSQGKYVLQPGE